MLLSLARPRQSERGIFTIIIHKYCWVIGESTRGKWVSATGMLKRLLKTYNRLNAIPGEREEHEEHEEEKKKYPGKNTRLYFSHWLKLLLPLL